MGKMEETTDGQPAMAAIYIEPEKRTNIALFCELVAALA
jgi:hypothetical protein